MKDKMLLYKHVFFQSINSRLIVLITFLLSFHSVSGEIQSYYISSSIGNDSYDGLAPVFDGTHGPWRSINKINHSIFHAGDSILFKRGDIWRENLTITSSGNTGEQITYSAYGTGTTKPVINGSDLISGLWSIYKDNIWKVSVPPEITAIAQLFVNNERQTLARTDGWRTIDATSADQTYIFDSNLTQPDDYWIGGNVVVRAEMWTIACSKIIASSGSDHTITFNKLKYTPKVNYGYYIENKLDLIDSPGEWFFDDVSHTLYLQLNTGQDPNNLLIEASVRRYCIFGTTKKYLTFSSLRIQKAAYSGITNIYGDNYKFQDNEISYCANFGVYCYDNGTLKSNVLIENNEISQVDVISSFGHGIFIWGYSNVTIQNNNINNIASDTNSPHRGVGAYVINGSNLKITNNLINETSGHGIHITNCPYSEVANNKLTRCITLLDDDGAIYTTQNMTGTVIENNLIDDCPGSTEGTPGKLYGTVGIYSDVTSYGDTIKYNIVSRCSYGAKMSVHTAIVGGKPATVHDINMINNVFYNNSISGLHLAEYAQDAIFNLKIKNNIFYTVGESQLAIINNRVGTSTKAIGIIDNNVYYNIIKEDLILHKIGSKSTYFTLGQWQSKTGLDSGNDANSLAANPGFVDAENGNFHLLASSPCIDAGTSFGRDTDFDGVSVPNGQNTDIGAFEFSFPTNVSGLPRQSKSLICFPNPCQNSTTIKYSVKSPGDVLFSIFDVSGCCLMNFTERASQPGKYIKPLDINGLSQGIYFLRKTFSEGEEIFKIFKKKI